MKMESLLLNKEYWATAHPKVMVRNVDRLLYRKYPYKIVIKRERDKKDPTYRICSKLYNIRADVESKFGGDVRVRVDGGYYVGTLSIAALTIDIIENIADTIKSFNDPLIRVSDVFGPSNLDALAAIQNGAFLKKRAQKYKYVAKIRYLSRTKRSGNHGEQILNHLNNLDVYVPDATRWQLVRNSWITSGQIYLNDPNVLSFLYLIDPKLIARISPLVQITNK